MADREAAGPQVLMLSWLTDLSRPVTAALERREVPVKHAHPPGSGTAFRAPRRRGGSAVPQLSAVEIDSIESVIAVFDEHSVRSRFGGRQTCRWRRALRAYANEAGDLITSTALTVGARRVLLICDARRLASGRRASATRWTHDLARRISYECLVNGLAGHSAGYAVIDTDDEVHEVAEAVVAWHDGYSNGQDPRWPLHPIAGGHGVTPSSSVPHRSPRS
ncbi:hypothetical protein XA26_51890 [Mycolicibacterium fortuitum]|uniref:Uncharacterized protein n=1 Tax=Mycolicibacterium fortuitum TaxID=1766 RepID=A0A0N7H9G8_MYCFO|nr:hypothetical protein [Mycolicibacterium fortuitum]ALI28983.1 hypothetical protein XA26_51890 [Mycolicibacterium fortuitum]